MKPKKLHKPGNAAVLKERIEKIITGLSNIYR